MWIIKIGITFHLVLLLDNIVAAQVASGPATWPQAAEQAAHLMNFKRLFSEHQDSKVAIAEVSAPSTDEMQSLGLVVAYSGARRAGFRNHPGQHSEMMPVTIPG